MASVVGDILGNAIGVAISPIPIIAVILMLFTPKARVNSIGFLLGWIIGLAVAGGIVLVVDIGGADGSESDGGGVLKIVVGVLFVVLGIRQWTQRPARGEAAEMPGWMASIDQFTAAKSFGLAFVLAAVNPKNLGLTIAAVSTIGASGLESGEEIGVLAIFIALASASVAAPVLLNLILGERAEDGLNSMRDWLVANNNTVMSVLFVVLGAKVAGDGLAVVS